jgi:hypothetical protein
LLRLQLLLHHCNESSLLRHALAADAADGFLLRWLILPLHRGRRRPVCRLRERLSMHNDESASCGIHSTHCTVHCQCPAADGRGARLGGAAQLNCRRAGRATAVALPDATERTPQIPRRPGTSYTFDFFSSQSERVACSQNPWYRATAAFAETNLFLFLETIDAHHFDFTYNNSHSRLPLSVATLERYKH